MKIARLVLAAALALSFAPVSFAADQAEKPKESCCDKAKKEGKECTHKCCEQAAKENKTCDKCNKKKEG